MIVLEALHEESKPLELQISWPKTSVQVFGGLLDVVRKSISWTASNTLVAWSITMVGHVKRSYGRMVWPIVL